MVSTLRSRLLWSYIAVILAALLFIAITLFGFATVSDARLLSPLERLTAISRTKQRELLRMWEQGAGGEALQGLLHSTASQADVRIMVVDTNAGEIVFDTVIEDNWVGEKLTGVQQPASLGQTNVARGSIFGTFIHPDGSRWLVFAEPNAALGRALIFYAQPEPTAGAFFREFFLQPLLIAGGLAMLLAIMLAFVIARSVSGPLRTMASAAEAIARGDFDQRAPQKGPGEVQRVARSFNSMAAQVKATQQAQRDFVANVSHDLKTPLTAISGWSQALLDGAADSPEDRQRAAQTIFDEADRMARMVNELLELARLESGQMQLTMRRVDLGAALADVYRSLEPQARSMGIDLSLESPPDLIVPGDPDRIVQIFTNLADNALTYTPAGGSVRLAARVAGEWVEGIVADTGRGIPSDELSRVFERFYRLEKSRSRREAGRGSGLGLAIVQELVTAHNGNVKVSSEVGRGTVFVVQLPIAKA